MTVLEAAEKPGGLPNTDVLDAGSELAVLSWDILSGDAKPGANVLLFDDNAAHPGMQAAAEIAQAGSQLEIVTPERFFAVEIGGLNHVAYAEIFQRHGVVITFNRRVTAARREGNRIAVTIGSDYTDIEETRLVDQLVVEHATLPLDDLYFALKPGSRNLGAVNYQALVAGRPQEDVCNPEGTYRLYRIGDAVHSHGRLRCVAAMQGFLTRSASVVVCAKGGCRWSVG